MNEKLKDMILSEHKEGNIVVMTIKGPMITPLQEFLKQPIEGILYDLNRDMGTVLTMIGKHEKWINDYAVSVVITELKRQLDEVSR